MSDKIIEIASKSKHGKRHTSVPALLLCLLFLFSLPYYTFLRKPRKTEKLDMEHFQTESSISHEVNKLNSIN